MGRRARRYAFGLSPNFTEARPNTRHNGHGIDAADVRACPSCSPDIYPYYGAKHRQRRWAL